MWYWTAYLMTHDMDSSGFELIMIGMRKNLRNANIFLVNWNKLTPLLPQSLPVEPEWPLVPSLNKWIQEKIQEIWCLFPTTKFKVSNYIESFSTFHSSGHRQCHVLHIFTFCFTGFTVKSHIFCNCYNNKLAVLLPVFLKTIWTDLLLSLPLAKRLFLLVPVHPLWHNSTHIYSKEQNDERLIAALQWDG